MRRTALIIALVFAGCSGMPSGKGGSGGSAGSGGGGAGSGGSGGGGTGGSGGGSAGNGGSGGGGGNGNTFSIGIGPIPVPAGQETVQCILIKMPTTTDVDVIGIATTLAPGSHHLIAYRSTETTENLTPTSCTSFDGVLNGEQPIFIADSLGQAMTLPTGVSYHFPAGQMVRLEAHYVNATPSALQGMGTVTFTTGPPATYQQADIMMCGSVASLSTQCLPPGKNPAMLPVGNFSGDANIDFTKINVFALTSHEHQRGTDVKIWKSTSASKTATQIFDNPNWNNPPLQVYNDSNLLTFQQGEGLAWQCSYNTMMDTGNICFGESATANEMCFIWAYYYPSVGKFIAEGDCWNN